MSSQGAGCVTQSASIHQLSWSVDGVGLVGTPELPHGPARPNPPAAAEASVHLHVKSPNHVESTEKRAGTEEAYQSHAVCTPLWVFGSFLFPFATPPPNTSPRLPMPRCATSADAEPGSVQGQTPKTIPKRLSLDAHRSHDSSPPGRCDPKRGGKDTPRRVRRRRTQPPLWPNGRESLEP